jgi:thioredoxin 1
MKNQMTALVLCFGLGAIAWNNLPQSKTNKLTTQSAAEARKSLVTFVEFGSVKCIPCRQMQPVMKAIEEKYGQPDDPLNAEVSITSRRAETSTLNIRALATSTW